MLSAIGIFETRGRHDVEYTKWTLPLQFLPDYRGAIRVAKALEDLQDTLKERICSQPHQITTELRIFRTQFDSYQFSMQRTLNHEAQIGTRFQSRWIPCEAV